MNDTARESADPLAAHSADAADATDAADAADAAHPADAARPADHQPTAWWSAPSGVRVADQPWQMPPGAPPSPPFAAPPAHAGPPSGGRHRSTVALAAVALAAGLVGGGVGAGVTYGITGGSSSTAPPAQSALNEPPASSDLQASDGSASAAQVAAKVLPSVVSITVAQNSGGGDEGSGVVISADGLVLTNNHVVEPAANGAGRVAVTFNNGNTVSASIVGRDPTSDLAVIKANGVSGLRVASLGTSADLVVGQQVVAVGSPFGLSGTVTSGIVSAKNRPVCTANCNTAGATPTVLDAIQTDAAINPGNSGGPLVDMKGNVVGINSAIRAVGTGIGGEAGNVGVGFAIPIDEARPIAKELTDNGFATHAVMGVTVGDATTNGITPGGAKLGSVVPNEGAEAAGLKAGDIIVKFGDRRIDDADSLIAAVHAARPGSKVEITYLRDGGQHTTTLTLGSARSD